MLHCESSAIIIPKPATRTFFFGYGSLMYPSGINGRGMKKRYEEKDLAVAQLRGFARGLFVRSSDQYLYYGIKEDPNSMINGVIFEVFTDYDYTCLMISEGAHKRFGKFEVYKSVDVTEKISGILLTSESRVFAVVPIKTTKIGFLSVDYIIDVWNGIQFWGKDFVNEFLSTGGRKYDKKLIEDRIVYSRRFYKEFVNLQKKEGLKKKCQAKKRNT